MEVFTDTSHSDLVIGEDDVITSACRGTAGNVHSSLKRGWKLLICSLIFVTPRRRISQPLTVVKNTGIKLSPPLLALHV